jgi:hypothetical protein
MVEVDGVLVGVTDGFGFLLAKPLHDVEFRQVCGFRGGESPQRVIALARRART